MALRGHPDFRRLWAGDTISQFGASVGVTVIPLLAAGVLNATPFEMGLLAAASTIAFLLIGLPAGVWVDRVRRKPLMIAMDVARAALVLSVPIAWWLGALGLPQLVVVSLAVGVCTVFFDVAYQSYLPSLVGRDQLVEGNSKLQASLSVAEVSGPAIGGYAAQLLGAANGVLATGIGYLTSAFFLVRIKKAEPAPDRHPDPHLRREVVEGLRFVFGNVTLRMIVACTGTSNFFHGIQNAVLVLFLLDVAGLSEGTAGLVLSAGGVGGVLGAAFAHRIGLLVGQARMIWLIPVLTWPFTLALPFVSGGWGLVLPMACLAVSTFGIVVYNVGQVSYRQAICPDHLLGRMNASIRWVVWGATPLGALLGGGLGSWSGIVPTLWVSVVGSVGGMVWLLLSPLRSMRDLPAATSVEAHG
ncbi:Predicted arabinose efflux permease, MFS family [Lentzea xinjiangensis]|uniref:Predicted arabinose efflux permease, MFS family n=1 Tax=Lentzea xinjiangensis TaxID=402600 RepID=A0A1H9I4I1_9PSEU|nr:MFS transporter [Lentzea xinjiangensis]SEQ69456.1 Predicted arabinose efflux permease, MFS family [Lentzea xinjiangensis]